MSREITIGCGYGENIAFFHFRAISIADEDKFTARFAETKDLVDDAKTKAETAICIEAVTNWATKAPSKRIAKGDGYEFKPFYSEKEAATVKDAIWMFFNDADDADAERLANQLVMAYRSRLQPTTVFP